jgi:integrase/recombinase XerD
MGQSISPKNQVIVDTKKTTTSIDYIFERKLESASEGLTPEYFRSLLQTSKANALTIAKYLESMRLEINLADNYRKTIIKLLTHISRFCNEKPFKQMEKKDILAFLDSYRKTEAADPLHRWISTYNLYNIHLTRFFKWLYYPDVDFKKRAKPECVENIPQLTRKEKSIYKPSDLWTQEDDLLFLKYCPSKRDRCYHAVSRDSSCRPHEILKLRIKDVVFKMAGDKQYAEVLVNGKTGSRHIPLIDSIPYLKDWLDDHPRKGNPNAPLICGFVKSLGRPVLPISISQRYAKYKKYLFPTLLDSPSVPPEDKKMIIELLKKPWNPYIRRHSALTEKAKILKEPILKMHAGWSQGSRMNLRYEHWFGNESSESLLEAYGIVTKIQQSQDKLKPKQCPNCSEPNKVDSKFCAKCRMILSYDSYTETLEGKDIRDVTISSLSDQVMQLMSEIQEIKNAIKDQ